MTTFWPSLGADATRRTACLADGRAVSYAELDARADEVARALHAAGARAGVPLALLLPSGIGFIEVLHGALRLGAVLLPLHERLGVTELAERVAQASPALLVHDDRHAGTAAALAVPATRVGDLRGGAAAPTAPRAPNQPLALLFTSGSGARPRPVPLTVSNLLWSALASAAVLGVRSDDRWLNCLTPAHVSGLSIYLRAALFGMTVVAHEGFDAASVNDAIDRGGVTFVSLVAAMLERLLSQRGERPFPPTLRCVLVGGGPLPQALRDDAARRGVPVSPTYGLTEASSQVATRAPGDLVGGGCGRPLPGTEIRIADGEILVRGPTVSTACADSDGWLHTGDLGTVDEHGCLHVHGRRDDLIITGGENVQPAEVEAVLSEHPAVAEAAVAGVADGAMSQAVVAWVRPRASLAPTSEDLRAHVRSRLAGFKVPRRVHLVDELPRTPLGKVARRQLREP